MTDAVAASSSSAADNTNDHGRQTQPEAAPTATELAQRKKQNRQMFNRKRGELLDNLLRDVDMLIYAELSAIYYMDCSFFRFVLRGVVQFMYLTPKQPPFPEHPTDRPMLGALLTSNLLCLFLHLWLTPPSAGETTRGYLHGGLAMDFIGQAGPSSRIYLILLDIIVFVMQLANMSAYMIRKRIKEAAAATASTPSTSNESAQPTARSGQDVDAEERGVRRSIEQQDIEMQTLNPASNVAPSVTETENDDTSDRTSLLRQTAERPAATDAHVFDAFYSGQIVLADLDIRRQVKDQMHLIKNYRVDRASSSGNEGGGWRDVLIQRALRLRNGADTLRGSVR